MVIQASYNGIMSVGLDDLLSEKGAVARRLQGFEVRPQQVEMAAAVQRTLEQHGRLVEGFFSAARKGDYAAVKATLAMPLWFDRKVIEASLPKFWVGEWRQFLKALTQDQVTGMKVFAFPPPATWSGRGRKTYGFVLKRSEKVIRVVDVSLEKSRGMGFICARSAKGWRIIGIDDNLIGERVNPSKKE